MNRKIDQPVLKVAFPYSTDLNEFDPARVQLAQQYILLENLYSELLQMNSTGDLVSAISDKWYWDKNEIHFEIRDGLKASDGLPLTAEDVAFSFIRLMRLGSSTHGDLRKILCDDDEKIEEGCSGIRVEKNKVILTPKKKNFAIFKSFTTIDFAIIPRRSVDETTGEIRDFTITSGPYFISDRLRDGTLILKANPHHFEYSKFIPQEVHYIHGNDRSTLSDFRSGEFDFLSIMDPSPIDDRLNLATDEKHFEVHATMPTNLELIHFTKKGLNDLTPARRWAIGARLKSAYGVAKANSLGLTLTDQYFPPAGKGSLETDQLTQIRKNIEVVDRLERGKGIVFALSSRHSIAVGEIIKAALPEAKLVPLTKLPEFDQDRAGEKDFPHAYFITMDTGFLESLPNISNTVISGFFGETKLERDSWLREYLSQSDESSRIQALRKLHLKSLLSPVIIPLGHKPYVTVLRKPWKGHFFRIHPECAVKKYHVDELIVWAKANAGALNLKVTWHSYLEQWQIPLFDVGVEIVIDGHRSLGRSVQENSKNAFGIALIEALERFISSTKVSEVGSGVAGHFSFAKASQSARSELIERDAILCHHLTKTPYQKISSSERFLEPYLNERSALPAELSWDFYSAQSITDDHVVLCRATATDEERKFAVFGFGCDLDLRLAVVHAFRESLGNAAVIESFNKQGQMMNLRTSTSRLYNNNFDHIFAGLSNNWNDEMAKCFPAQNPASEFEKSSPVQPSFQYSELEQPFPELQKLGLIFVQATSAELQTLFTGFPGSSNVNIQRLRSFANRELNLSNLNSLLHPIG